MSAEKPTRSATEQSTDFTRREALIRGAKLGSVVWVAPVMTSMQLLPGTAEVTSPPPTTTTSTSSTTTSTSTTTTTMPTTGDISFIGMQITCGEGLAAMGYTIKYEGCVGDDCFESEPGKFPDCDGFTVSGEKADGDELGFEVIGPDSSGCVQVVVPVGCVVTRSAVKTGNDAQGTGCCQAGPTGGGTLTFCPPSC